MPKRYNIVNMAVPFQVPINDYSKQFVRWNSFYHLVSYIQGSHYSVRISHKVHDHLLTISWVKPHTVFHTIIFFLSQTAKSNRLLELRGTTSNTVVSSIYFNLECQSPSTINHYSKKRNSKFSSLWNTTIGVAPWRQGITDSHRLGAVGQRGSYPGIQSLIDIQET